MEDFLLVVLTIAVIGLFVRQRGRAAERAQLAELSKHVDNLEQRLRWSERMLRTQMEARAQAEAAAPDTAAGMPAASGVPAEATATPAAFAPYAAAHQHAPATASMRVATPPVSAPPVQTTTPLVAQPAAAPPVVSQSVPAAPKRSVSLEERLGQNWLNKLGIVAVVVGVASFLSLELRTLGPAGKSGIGIAVSLMLLAFGIFLERKPNYRVFARAAIGGGWALTFFVTFALYHVAAMQVLHSQAIDLVLMMVVAIAMVAHSLRYKSQVVTALAFLLAFLTVGISEVTLFSLVAGALLAAGLVYVAARERWFELALAGLVGAYLNHFLWLHRVLPNGAVPGHPFAAFLPSAGLLLFYWLLFRLFYVFRVPETRQQQLVSTLTAVLNSAGLLGLLKYQSAHPEWAFYGLLALGALELTLAFVARRRHHTAFVVLTIIASALLLAAVPFKFSGSSWSMLWLLEAEMLFLAGIALKEIVFRRLGLLAGMATAAALFFNGVAPVFLYRQMHADAPVQLAMGIGLLSAAVLFWLNAEGLTRRFDLLAAQEVDRAGFAITSCLAMLCASAGLWVLVPGAWTLIAWLCLGLALCFAADKLGASRLAAQADLVAVAAVLRAVIINLQRNAHRAGAAGTWSGTRALTVTLAAALLYLHMRRRTRLHPAAPDYIPAAYSWAAGGLLGLLLWYELQPASTTVAWGVLGLVLFELGLTLRKDFFRQQGYAFLAASFLRLYFVNLTLESNGVLLGPRLYTTLPLIAAYFWVYERGQAQASADTAPHRFDRIASLAAAWLGTVALASLAYFELRPAWVCIAWAALALGAMSAAWSLRRTVFTLQALVLLVAAAARALMFNVFAPAPLAMTLSTGRAFTVAAACALMLLALIPAFAVRRQRTLTEPAVASSWRSFVFGRPEQMFFFVPLLLITLLLAVQLRAGMITIAWSALGLVTFLLALWLGERSFRLAGLGLLLLCVGKIVCVDIWHATPADRVLTLIVLGAALLFGLLPLFALSRNDPEAAMKRWLPLSLIVLAGIAAVVAAQWQHISTRASPQGVLTAAADAQHELTRVPASVDRMSDEEEIALGNEMAARYATELPAGAPQSARPSAMEAYLQRIGERTAAHARRRLPWHFHYIADAGFVNAFALPGGHVFVGQGLLALMQSEDALAAVLGHEVEHIDLRHCADRAQLEAHLRNLGALGELAGLPAEIFMAGYSKEQELEADRDGTTLAVEAGYSPRGILQLFAEFSKLEQRWGGSTAPAAPGPVSEAAGVSLATLQGYFQSHPPAAQRSRQIEAMIAAQRWSSPPLQPLRCRSVSAGKCSSSAG